MCTSHPGIRQRLDHLAGLSITGVILNSIHHAPGADSDRGVMDFMHVDPLLGTIEDFKNLLKELKKNGRLLKDIILFKILSDRKSIKYTVSRL